MEVVRRIFRSVAEGVSVRSVRISLERDGIPAPSGIGRWNHTAIRNIIGSELYVPHTYEEVAALSELDEIRETAERWRRSSAWSATGTR